MRSCSFFFLMIRRPPRSTLFPYTRSSDLLRFDLGPGLDFERRGELGSPGVCALPAQAGLVLAPDLVRQARNGPLRDRKSTRLNSSHLVISYAVFCLKKKSICLSHDTLFRR